MTVQHTAFSFQVRSLMQVCSCRKDIKHGLFHTVLAATPVRLLFSPIVFENMFR